MCGFSEPTTEQQKEYEKAEPKLYERLGKQQGEY